MPMTLRLTALLLSLLASPLLLACGSGGSDAGESKVRTAPNGDRFNDADVAFATRMIPHHAQALQLVDLTRNRELRPEVLALAEQIREEQAPEIEAMTRWLTDWGKPVPQTPRDHVNAEAPDHDGGSMKDMGSRPGMLSARQLADLALATGTEFEQKWLTLMSSHHRGAIAMARPERADGHFAGAVRLAGDIITAQQREIDMMARLAKE